MNQKPIIIYTREAYIRNKDNYIGNPLAEFDMQIDTILTTFNQTDAKLMQLIDKAELFERDGQFGIQTPHGIADVYKLSGGCKTALLTNHLEGKIISLNLCGMNALLAIFSLVDPCKNRYLLKHANFKGIEKCEKDFTFKLNNRDECNLWELYTALV